MEVNFIVVDAYSPYTTIVARLWLHTMGAVPSTLHLKVKYLSDGRVEELVGSQSMARQCMVVAIRHQIRGWPSRRRTYSNQWCRSCLQGQQQKGLSVSNCRKLLLATMRRNSSRKEELIDFLRKNIVVFAWSAYKDPEVDADFICHHLNVNPSVLPKKQPPRHSSKEHSDAIKEEVLNFCGLGP